MKMNIGTVRKKILILSGSGRKNGNTQSLAEAFARKCRKEGHRVTILELSEFQIKHCLSCDYCKKYSGICIQNDDMWQIAKIIRECEVLIFATPVYYGGMSSRLKAVIDRFYGINIRDCGVKESALLSVAGRTAESAADQVIQYYHYLTDFFGWKDCGMINAIGFEEKGSLKGNVLKDMVAQSDISFL